MSTPNGSLVSYLPVAEFLKRADLRSVAKLCSDTDSPVPVSSLPADINLNAALMDASGLLEGALLAGDRYTTADLSVLNGASQALLYRVLTMLTTELLWMRRLNRDYEPPKAFEFIERFLQDLADGKRIFALQEVADAGIGLTDVVETATDVEARDLPSFQMRRMFGRRNNRRSSTWFGGGW